MMEDQSMFYGAKPGVFGNARMLRGTETKAEKLLWERLRKNQLDGFRFKRQHPISTFIADFYCHKAKLVIEIDEAYHDHEYQQKYDAYRTRIMHELGLVVIRFSDQQVYEGLDEVIDNIRKYLPS